MHGFAAHFLRALSAGTPRNSMRGIRFSVCGEVRTSPRGRQLSKVSPQFISHQILYLFLLTQYIFYIMFTPS
jgi:hypothetical protein